MYCYYCGNAIDEEKQCCTRCGTSVKEIKIDFDRLNSITKTLEKEADNSVVELMNDESTDSIDLTKNDEKNNTVNEDNKPKKVKVKIKPKKK